MIVLDHWTGPNRNTSFEPNWLEFPLVVLKSDKKRKKEKERKKN
jgi:hypothetical protein